MFILDEVCFNSSCTLSAGILTIVCVRVCVYVRARVRMPLRFIHVETEQLFQLTTRAHI